MPAGTQNKRAPKSSAPKSSAPKSSAPAPVSLAKQATQAKAAKSRPVFRDVPGIQRVPLADGRVGCVQAQVILCADGSLDHGPYMLTIPKKNADGTEGGQRFPLADVQLIADAYRAAGVELV